MPRPDGWGQASEQEDLGWDFEGARRFHTSLGLKMTPAQRFQWLEETVAEMRQLCGLAKFGRPIGVSDQGPPQD